MTMPTMQEIDEWERVARTQKVAEIHHTALANLCAAARRGVEADAEIARLNLLNDGHQRLATQYRERAEKAEGELAALKAAQPQEYPSSADDEATRWRHGEPMQPERVSVPVSDERIMEIFVNNGVSPLAFARALLSEAGTREGTDYKALYFDLIMQVGNKYPGESRHDTAKRYIQRTETQPAQAGQAAAQEGK